MTFRRILLALIAAVVVFASANLTVAQTGGDMGKKTDATFVTPASAPPIIYFSKDSVTKHFEAGDTMYQDPTDARDYRIAASRREKPGTAEIHMKWTDVCYIVKGEATLVTGGTVMNIRPTNTFPDGKPYPQDEIRGGDIVGGKSQHLSAGDVVVIPNGVPHSFIDVNSSFWYYNVKVR